MLRLIYNALLYLAAPVALAVTALRGLRDPAYRGRLRERLGFVDGTLLSGPSPSLSDPSAPDDGAPALLWIHAVSVGEVQAAAALLRALRGRYPRHGLLVTTATPTGAERVRALFGAEVAHAYLPYDLPGAVRRFLMAVRPAIAIIMEREIWPNLYHACNRRGIPLLIASARLTERSTRLYQRLIALFAPVLAGDVTIAAQTENDARRFRAIGVAAGRVHVTGNVKFDMDVDAALQEAGATLRASGFPGRMVWVAGSTHEGEEDMLLDAHQGLRARHPDGLLVLAPRHPGRFESVRALLAARAIRFVSRSTGEPVSEQIEVLLLDTLGELMTFYAAGDIAFVGGSLVPIGGHNLLEPAALGRPIVVGPCNFNGPDVARMLLDSGAAVEVASGMQLQATVVELAGDESRRTDMGQRGQRIVAENRGAVARVMQLVARLLH